MTRSALAFAIALLAALSMPALSAAQDNSAIDQYTESVPEAGSGSGGSDESGGGSGGSGGSGQNEADDGTTAQPPTPAAPAGSDDSSTGGGAVSSGSGGGGDGGEARAGGSPQEDSRGESSETAQTSSGGVDAVNASAETSDSGPIAIGLAIALVASLLAAVAFVLVRRRRGAPGSA